MFLYMSFFYRQHINFPAQLSNSERYVDGYSSFLKLTLYTMAILFISTRSEYYTLSVERSITTHTGLIALT